MAGDKRGGIGVRRSTQGSAISPIQALICLSSVSDAARLMQSEILARSASVGTNASCAKLCAGAKRIMPNCKKQMRIIIITWLPSLISVP